MPPDNISNSRENDVALYKKDRDALMTPGQKIQHAWPLLRHILKAVANVYTDRNSPNCLYIISMDCTKIDNNAIIKT